MIIGLVESSSSLEEGLFLSCVWVYFYPVCGSIFTLCVGLFLSYVWVYFYPMCGSMAWGAFWCYDSIMRRSKYFYWKRYTRCVTTLSENPPQSAMNRSLVSHCFRWASSESLCKNESTNTRKFASPNGRLINRWVF